MKITNPVFSIIIAAVVAAWILPAVDAYAQHGFAEPNPPTYSSEPSPPTSFPTVQPRASTEWTLHKSADGTHPNGNEQQFLWFMNRARTNPTLEGEWLAIVDDSDTASARDNYAGVDLTKMKSEFATYSPKPPAAFDRRLYDACKSHSDYMISTDSQTHDGQSQRITDAGFSYTAYGLSVFAYTKSSIYGHAGFNIDWTNQTADGMQDGRGHRMNLMGLNYDTTNMGVAVVETSDPGLNVGPLVVTKDYCIANTGSADHFNKFIVGTVWTDSNSNQQYDPGEGHSGVTVNPAEGTYYAVTGAAGGFAIPATATGTYNVTFSGGAVSTPVVKSVTVGSQSVLLVWNDADSWNSSSIIPTVTDWSLLGLMLLISAVFARAVYLSRSRAAV